MTPRPSWFQALVKPSRNPCEMVLCASSVPENEKGYVNLKYATAQVPISRKKALCFLSFTKYLPETLTKLNGETFP